MFQQNFQGELFGDENITRLRGKTCHNLPGFWPCTLAKLSNLSGYHGRGIPEYSSYCPPSKTQIIGSTVVAFLFISGIWSDLCQKPRLSLMGWPSSQPLPPPGHCSKKSHKTILDSGVEICQVAAHATSNPAIKRNNSLQVEGICCVTLNSCYVRFVVFTIWFHPACGFVVSSLRVQPQRCHQCQVHDWHQCRSKHPGNSPWVWCRKLGRYELYIGMWEKKDELAVNFKCKLVLQL